MGATVKRGGAALLAVLTALLMVATFASAASAHGVETADDPDSPCLATTNGLTRAQGNYEHDDGAGVSCTDITHALAHPGSGEVESVDNDSPADAVNVIRDYGLENAPIIIGVIGAIFLVGLTFYLVRRGLMKARGAMRL